MLAEKLRWGAERRAQSSKVRGKTIAGISRILTSTQVCSAVFCPVWPSLTTIQFLCSLPPRSRPVMIMEASMISPRPALRKFAHGPGVRAEFTPHRTLYPPPPVRSIYPVRSTYPSVAATIAAGLPSDLPLANGFNALTEDLTSHALRP